LGFEKQEIAAAANEDSFLNFPPNSTTACLKYYLDTATASMYIIHLICYVAGVRTAAFVTVYAQISFLGSFVLSFFFVPKTYWKLRVLIKLERLHARGNGSGV